MNIKTIKILALAEFILISALSACLLGRATAAPTGTAEQMPASLKGVHIHYTYDRQHFFAPAWMADPIDCDGTQIAATETGRTVRLIESFLAAYEPGLLRRNLTDIYLTGDLHCYGHQYGGTNSTSSLYIRVGSRAEGYTDRVLLAIMHEEFSSILIRQYPFPAGRWQLLNGAGYRYPDDSIEIMDEPGQNEEAPAEWLRRGFLTPYAASSMENDINEYAGWMFVWPDRLCDYGTQYPAVKEKAQFLNAFYRSIDPGMEVWSCKWDPSYISLALPDLGPGPMQ